MAVNPIIKLPQTKAMVFFFKKGGEKEGKKREGESWERPTDLKSISTYVLLETGEGKIKWQIYSIK